MAAGIAKGDRGRTKSNLEVLHAPKRVRHRGMSRLVFFVVAAARLVGSGCA